MTSGVRFTHHEGGSTFVTTGAFGSDPGEVPACANNWETHKLHMAPAMKSAAALRRSVLEQKIEVFTWEA
jgi:hypothetical protein